MMNTQEAITIREAGKMSFNDNIDDGQGMRNAKKFLKDLSVEFAKRSRMFFDASDNDLPYIYREKQLHSILVPLLWDISDVVMTEAPTHRLSDSDKEEKFGWIDYWVKKGTTIFLIELKHSYFGYSSNKLRDSSLQKWKDALEQIEKISDPESFAKSENVVKIALNVITTYTSSSIESNSIEECKDIYQRIENTFEKEKEKPDFVANWSVHNDMLLDYEYDNGRECYPYVHIIAKVEPVE